MYLGVRDDEQAVWRESESVVVRKVWFVTTTVGGFGERRSLFMRFLGW